MDSPPPDAAAVKVATALATFGAAIEPVKEAVQGYRDDLIARGFSPTAAETMSMEYHRLLFQKMLG